MFCGSTVSAQRISLDYNEIGIDILVYMKAACKSLFLIIIALFTHNTFGEQQQHIISGVVLNQLGEGVSGTEIFIYPSDYLNTNVKNGSFSEAYKSTKSTEGGFYKISTVPDKDLIVIGNHKNLWFIRKTTPEETNPVSDTLREGGSLVFFTKYSASNLRNTTAYVYGTPFRVKSDKNGNISFNNIPKGTLKSLIISELPGYHDIVCSLHVRPAQTDTFKDTLPFVYSGPQKIMNLHAGLDSSGKAIQLKWDCNLHINNGFRIFRAPANSAFTIKPYSIVKNVHFTDTELTKFAQSAGFSYYISYPGYLNSDTVTVYPPKRSSEQPTPLVKKIPAMKLIVHAFANHKTVSPFEKIHLYGTAEPQTENIISWQWSVRGSPFTEVIQGDTTITAPATPGKISGIIKAISRSGQTALDTVHITVETSSLRVEASGDTIAGIYDQIKLSANVFSTKKVVSLGWDIGNRGSFTFTPNGNITIGPFKSPEKKIVCIVRAIDESGEQDFDTVSIAVSLQWDSRPLPGSYPNHKGQTLLNYNSRLWLIGGSMNDVCNSPDALAWNLVTDTAPFGKRFGHNAIVFQNKIWVIGGKIGQDSLPGDIYSSIDGKVWNREISASFLKRYYHTTVVLNDELFLVGGINDTPEKPCLNDIWSTKDGRHWNLIAESAEFDPRYGHGSTLFKNSIIIAGGFYDGIDGSKIYTDTWSSKNGRIWVKESDKIGFENNQFLTLLNYDDKLWAFGGFYEGNNNTPGFSNISLSNDGINWIKINGLSPRRTESYFLSGVIFKDKITLSPSGNRSILIMK